MGFRLLLLIWIFTPFTRIASGQTTQLALAYFTDFESNAREISQNWSQLGFRYFAHPEEVCQQKEPLKWKEKLEKYQNECQQKAEFLGQSNLKKAYLRWINEIKESALPPCPPNPLDSNLIGQENLKSDSIIYLKKMLQATRILDAENRNFQMINRFPQEKIVAPIGKGMEKWVLSYQQSYRLKRLHALVTSMVENQMKSFAYESDPLEMGGKFEHSLAFCDSIQLKIKNIKSIPGDQKMRAAALESIRQYRLEIKNDWPRLVGFLKVDLEFTAKNLTMKAKKEPTVAEKEWFKQEVKQYNENLKQANAHIKEMDLKRKNHQKEFQNAMENFLQAHVM